MDAKLPPNTLRNADGTAYQAGVDEAVLIEQLADKEHDSWARWMKYLFSRCIKNSDGSRTIPEELVEWWNSLADLPYSHLSERAKQSDREEVAHILPIIHEYFHQ